MIQSSATKPFALNSEDAKTITARSRSNFSSSFFFLPPEKRLAIQRVYAFFRVVDDVVDEEADPGRQKELLDSWKRELVKTYEGITIVPLLKELKASIDRFRIPRDYFLKLIEGCEMDITKKRYETFRELHEYCTLVASMVGLVCMKIFEYHAPAGEKAAVDLGIALQLTNIIRDVGVDLESGRIYLPQEELNQFRVGIGDLAAKNPGPGFFQLMEFQYRRALSYYESGMAEFKNDTDKKLLAARIMGHVYRRLLEKIRRKNYPVLDARVRLNFAEKIAILIPILYRHYLSLR
ncbi:MAG: squalene/phytoene synthase family protein [Deltaproteobacteria bacterium]|nr:squalene/phytoene synthase family protein [Deltaproteobacteria bacterium]